MSFPPSQLDANQVLQGAYDDDTSSLRTTATATVVGGDITIESSHVDDSMRLGDGTNYIGSTTVGPSVGLDVHVNNTSLAVTGPLTDSELRASPIPVTGIDIDIRDLAFATDKVDVSGSAVSVSNFPSVQPVNDNGDSLTVDGTVSAIQSGIWNINNVSGTISLPTGAATETTLSTRLADSTFTTRINTQGQKTMASSTPVVIASDQTVIPISDNGGSLTIDGTVGATQSGTWNINNISGIVSLPTGASTSANQITANSSLSSIDNKLTAPVATSRSTGTASSTTVSVSTTDSIILAANSNRKDFIITNVGGNAVYLGFGVAITTTTYHASISTVLGNDFFRPASVIYTGAIHAIRSSGSTNVIITEFT